MTSRRDLLAGVAATLLPVIALSACHAQRQSQTDDWSPVPLDSAAGLDRNLQATLSDSGSLESLRNVTVVHRGRLLAERYFNATSLDDLVPIRSATLSVVSLLVGVALRDGKLGSLSQAVDELLPDLSANWPAGAAASVTLDQILGRRSGIAYANAQQGEPLEAASDLVNYVLSHPLDTRGAYFWNCNDATVSLLTPILSNVWHMRLEVIAVRVLFRPLGIQRYAWQRDRLRNAKACTGLRLRPRDLAKIAWLVADRGRWRGTQLVPAAWIEASTTPTMAATWQAGPATSVEYGLLWFTGNLAGQKVAWAWGYGAQVALAVPSLQLAVCITTHEPLPRALDAQNRVVMGLVETIVEQVARS